MSAMLRRESEGAVAQEPSIASAAEVVGGAARVDAANGVDGVTPAPTEGGALPSWASGTVPRAPAWRRPLWWLIALALAASLLAVAALKTSRQAELGGAALTAAVASNAAQDSARSTSGDARTKGDAAAETSLFSVVSSRVQQGLGVEAAPALPRADALLLRAKTTPGSPEARLLRVYALIAAADGAQAFEEARKLAQDVPNFGLANLVYADLLKARTAPLASFGAATVRASESRPASASAADASTSPAERLKDLSAEARARVGGVTGLPPPGTVPSQFLFVAPSVQHAIAVDASRSRLYLFENTPNGLVLKRDFYASVGKLGTAKRIEGDLRTPLGVYFVTGQLPRAKLADRYGASAMVLNYPNQYDQLRGRTGSGIWLHGVESSYFSRAPLATDGCVALSNTDLLSLTQQVTRQATPVVIADRLDWVLPAGLPKPPASFTQALEAWRSARQQADPSSEMALYANAASSSTLGAPSLAWVAAASSGAAATGASGAAGATGSHWVDVLRAERNRPGSGASNITQLSMLAWHDKDDVMLVTYSETTARDAHPRLKRQYWLRQGERWNIVFDGAVG